MQNCTQQQDLIRRFYRALDNNDQEVLNQILLPNLVVYNPGPQSREDNLCGVSKFTSTFENLQITIHEQVSRGDLVATYPGAGPIAENFRANGINSAGHRICS